MFLYGHKRKLKRGFVWCFEWIVAFFYANFIVSVPDVSIFVNEASIVARARARSCRIHSLVRPDYVLYVCCFFFGENSDNIWTDCM